MTKGFWKDYGAVEAKADFVNRDKLRFFGLQAPKLTMADIPATYDGLLASPFASLYGAQTWAEDWAELFTWARFAALGGELQVDLLDGAGTVQRTWRPLSNPRLGQRLAAVSTLFRQVE